MNTLGPLLHAFFEDHLKIQKGLRPASIRSYRDTLKLYLAHVAAACHKPITRLTCNHLDADRVLVFLHDIESTRHNGVRTRNQRLAALRTFYRFLAGRDPGVLWQAQRVDAIPTKRCTAVATCYLERDQIDALFKGLPTAGGEALRDRALLMLLYNTGARVQEICDLCVADVDLQGPLRVRLHGKGDKWRSCPLWPETASLLRQLPTVCRGLPLGPLFRSRKRQAMTRFGIYKLVRRHTAALTIDAFGNRHHGVSPHVFRHTTAMHLLESGVDINVIRAWLGHVSLDTTNRYAEITLRTKEAAVSACLPPESTDSAESHRSVRWHDDQELLNWLQSL